MRGDIYCIPVATTFGLNLAMITLFRRLKSCNIPFKRIQHVFIYWRGTFMPMRWVETRAPASWMSLSNQNNNIKSSQKRYEKCYKQWDFGSYVSSWSIFRYAWLCPGTSDGTSIFYITPVLTIHLHAAYSSTRLKSCQEHISGRITTKIAWKPPSFMRGMKSVPCLGLGM